MNDKIAKRLTDYSFFEKKALKHYLEELNEHDNVSEEELVKNFKAFEHKLDILDPLDFLPDIQPDQKIPQSHIRDFSMQKHGRFIKIRKHQQEYIEMFYTYSGTCTRIINNKEIVLETGDLVILDTNSYHEAKPAGFNDIVINMNMNTNYFDSLFFKQLDSIEESSFISSFFLNVIYQKQKFDGYLLFKTNKNPKIKLLIEAMLEEFYEEKLAFKTMMDKYLTLLFIELIRIYSDSTEEENSFLSAQRISEIFKYINLNLETVSLNSMSQHFGYHPNYFSKYVKKLTNKKFSDLILEEKLKRSAILLSQTNNSVEKICQILNITNTSYFYKKFKDYYGSTPKQYRKLAATTL